jgi:hypothetical protein
MIYLKSILAGIAAVLLILILFVVLLFAIPLLLQLGTGTGSGGIGAVSSGFSELTFAGLVVLAFVGGFYWEFRRASRARSSLVR